VNPDIAYLGLGSNLGDREAHLRAAVDRLAESDSMEIVALTAVEETDPVGFTDQGPFLNQMVAVRTELSPHDLLGECQRIEREGGRVRLRRWGPRTIDIDIVRFGDRIVAADDLAIPHPQIEARDFWVREIRELDGLLDAARPK
jgi:2-amino-4-hydroxy-6-hydroxymethyldihydropteridine diphosphokinase